MEADLYSHYKPEEVGDRWPMTMELWPWARQLCLVKESYKAMPGINSLVQSFANVSGI